MRKEVLLSAALALAGLLAIVLYKTTELQNIPVATETAPEVNDTQEPNVKPTPKYKVSFCFWWYTDAKGQNIETCNPADPNQFNTLSVVRDHVLEISERLIRAISVRSDIKSAVHFSMNVSDFDKTSGEWNIIQQFEQQYDDYRNIDISEFEKFILESLQKLDPPTQAAVTTAVFYFLKVAPCTL